LVGSLLGLFGLNCVVHVLGKRALRIPVENRQSVESLPNGFGAAVVNSDRPPVDVLSIAFVAADAGWFPVSLNDGGAALVENAVTIRAADFALNCRLDCELSNSGFSVKVSGHYLRY